MSDLVSLALIEATASYPAGGMEVGTDVSRRARRERERLEASVIR